MRFVAYRCKIVHVAKYRLLLGSRQMATRTYDEAINKLNSLQSNFAAIEASRASGGRIVQFAKHEMVEYLARIGYKPEDLNRLNVIHVTGTKGKGSTCAFVDSVVRKAAPDWKVGLFTSPHLVSVRERIRVNGVPISEEGFVKYFFEVWDRLEENKTTKYPDTQLHPAYFRFLTLMAYHVFLTLKIDVTILEVGIGGEYDSTNIVPQPLATGITTLGLDHTFLLGKTLAEIAWQKGGIYKEGVPAFTVEQPDDAMVVLRKRASDIKSSSFTIVPVNPELKGVELGLAGAHQVTNASLAVQLCNAFFKARPAPLSSTSAPPSIDTQADTAILSDGFLEGLKEARCPGRCQTVRDPYDRRSFWYLDGAHTVESLTCCAEWFVAPGSGIKDDTKRVLVFNCTNGRSGDSLLGALLSTIEKKLGTSDPQMLATFFEHVIFCTNVTYSSGEWKPEFTAVSADPADIETLATQSRLAKAWSQLVPAFPKENVHVLPSIEHAVKLVRRLRGENDKPIDALVAGSLLLVGGLIEVAGLTKAALGI